MNIEYLLVSIIKTLPFPILFIQPLKKRLRHSAGATVSITFLCCFICLIFASMVSEIFTASGFSHLISSALFLILTILILYSLTDLKPLILTFLLFFCKNYEDLAILLADTLKTFLPGQFIPGQSLLLQTISLLITLPVIYRLFNSFLIPVCTQTENFSFWKYLWLLPAFYYSLYRLILQPGYLTDILEAVPLQRMVAAIWIIGVLLSYFFLFRVMTETLESAMLKEKLRSAGVLAQMQKEQYLMLQNNIEETKRNRHDLKQQLIVIQNYIRQNRLEEALDHIASYLDHYPATPETFCGNYAMNSILRYYVDMARFNHIDIRVQAGLHKDMVIPEVDLCTLLGNLMLNAVEGCLRTEEEEKFIRLNIAAASASLLTIKISNSYSGEIHIHDGVFYSSKRNSEGIGTVSVRQVVEKYNGTLNYSFKDRVFLVSILLVLPVSS